MNNKIDNQEAIVRYEAIMKRLRNIKLVLDIIGVILMVAWCAFLLAAAIYDYNGYDLSNLIVGIVVVFPAGLICCMTADSIGTCFDYEKEHICKECGHIHKKNPDVDNKILNGHALCPMCNKITKHKDIRNKDKMKTNTEAETVSANAVQL